MDLIKENFQKISEQAKKDSVFVEMLLNGGESLSIGYQKRKVDKFSSNQTQMAGFRVVMGGSQGYAYTENLSLESLLRTYQEALSSAKMLSTGKTNQKIPVVSDKASVDSMSDLYVPQEVAMADKMKVAQDLEDLLLKQDARITSVPYSGFSEGTSWRRILNSEGIDREFKQNHYSGYAYALAKNGEEAKMDGESFVVRDFKGINAADVVKKAAQKSLAKLGAKKLTTGTYPVVICRETAGSFLGMIENYFSARAVHESKSLLAGKLGTAIGSPLLTLIDNPLEKNLMAARPFDSEGSVSKKTTLIEKGVLRNYLTNLEYSEKMNLPHTSSASRSATSEMDIGSSNLIVEKGNNKLEDLLKKYPKVVFLTDINGGMHSGFKSSTGDFSLPGEGFLYENGQNKGPIDQFVFSGNILEMIKDIEALGDTYCKPHSSTLIPDLLISKMSFAGA